MLIEAGLSFLGAGVPPEVPSWGNIIAQGRTFFQIAPWTILIPGAFLAVTVLAVDLLGDGPCDRVGPPVGRRPLTPLPAVADPPPHSTRWAARWRPVAGRWLVWGGG